MWEILFTRHVRRKNASSKKAGHRNLLEAKRNHNCWVPSQVGDGGTDDVGTWFKAKWSNDDDLGHILIDGVVQMPCGCIGTISLVPMGLCHIQNSIGKAPASPLRSSAPAKQQAKKGGNCTV